MPKYPFTPTYHTLPQALTDHNLAQLGDAYINFIYSLALSAKKGQPSGKKVKGAVLADALRKAGLRECMPSRMTSHDLADAAEALIVYAWLSNHITLEESVATLQQTDELNDGFARLLKKAKDRIMLS